MTPDELTKILASFDRTVAALEKRAGQNYEAGKGLGAAAAGKGRKGAVASTAVTGMLSCGDSHCCKVWC